jgi:hypothetical protein
MKSLTSLLYGVGILGLVKVIQLVIVIAVWLFPQLEFFTTALLPRPCSRVCRLVCVWHIKFNHKTKKTLANTQTLEDFHAEDLVAVGQCFLLAPL